MTSVSDRFRHLRQQGKCALIPFLTAGDPDRETTARALRVLDRAGADLIELGVPYSDPLADGPVIQAAATRALARGTTLESVLEIARDAGEEIEAPIILFTYYNPVYSRGIEPFLDRVESAGIRGLVVPDLPLEEADSLLDPAADRGIEVTLLVAPTSPGERIEAIARRSRGFIYLVSVTGVTGTRARVDERVAGSIASIRSVTDKPIGVGFGISGPEQALQVKKWGADGIVVGSALVTLLAENPPEVGLRSLEEFCQSLKSALETR